MTSVCWWCSTSEDLVNMNHFFIVIASRSTLTRSGIPVRIPSLGQIDLFKNYFYSTEACAKKKNFFRINVNVNVQWTRFLNLYAWNNPRRVAMPLKSTIVSIRYRTRVISAISLILFNPYFSSRLLYITPGPVGWGCRIHRLHLCRGVRLSQWVSWYDTKQSDGEAPVMLEFGRMRSTPLLWVK